MEATTLLDRLWCRNCGGPLLDQPPFNLEGIANDFDLNLMMSCLHCIVPDRQIARDAGRIADRLLWWLLIEGQVRIRTQTTKAPWVAPEDLTFQEQTRSTNSARSYLSEAVRDIPGVWVATHSRLHKTNSSYMLGHLKLWNTPCKCDLK